MMLMVASLFPNKIHFKMMQVIMESTVLIVATNIQYKGAMIATTTSDVDDDKRPFFYYRIRKPLEGGRGGRGSGNYNITHCRCRRHGSACGRHRGWSFQLLF